MKLSLKDWKEYQKCVAMYIKSGKEIVVTSWINTMVRKGYDKQHIRDLVYVTRQKIKLGIL
jgi:hypothetical protein